MSKGKIFVMSPITVYFIFFRPTDSMKKDFAQGIFFNISDEDAVAQSCRTNLLKVTRAFFKNLVSMEKAFMSFSFFSFLFFFSSAFETFYGSCSFQKLALEVFLRLC